MTQDNREFNGMNSAFEKVRIVSHKSDRNCSNNLDILKPKLLDEIDQVCQRKKHPNTDSTYDSIAPACATNIDKELIEVVIEALIAQNDISNKKLLKIVIRFINEIKKKSLYQMPAPL